MTQGDAATVLVVDDEEQVADLYAEQLRQRYSVRVAYGGEAALETIDSDVDVVLLDRRMPGLDGDEVLRRLRDQGYDVGVVMVTAVDPTEDVLELPFDEYLTKPVSGDQLHGTVEQLLTIRDYDDLFREYLTVTSKLTLLEVAKTEIQLENNASYANLEAEADRLEERLRAERDDADDVIEWLRGSDKLDSAF